MTNIAIIGAGGFGREVLDVFEACNAVKLEYDVLGFIVQKHYGAPGDIVNGKPILGDFDWLKQHRDEVFVTCAVGSPQHRRRLVQQASELGCRFCSVIHPSTLMTRWVTLGEGVVITAGCILSNNIRIGHHVHLNPACTIGHDVVLMDFATLAPGVLISGNAVLGFGCYLGTGASVIEKKQIGDWSIVGAGGVVTVDVPPNTTAVGIPAKVIKTRTPEWQLT